MNTATPTEGRQSGRRGLSDLSRSIAHLDTAALTVVVAVTTCALLLTRRMRVSRNSVLIALGTFFSLSTALLRLGRRSGVTDEESRGILPGDDLLLHSSVVTDRAITVNAPLEEVWPWVVQMGYHRGGWYTSRRLDKILWHIDNPSSDRVVPEYQDVHVGDIIPDGEPGTAYFSVAAIEKNRHIVYLDDVGSHVPGIAFTWAFVLWPLGDGTTRIQVRWRNGPVTSLLTRIAVRLLVAPADFVMMNQVLGGIKRRAERARRSRTSAALPSGTHGSMVVVEEEVDIRRPPEDVFDYCADLMHEPEWNPKMRHVETLTDGPVGVGARYEADLVPGDPMVIRYVRFDRPVRCTRTPCAVAHRISRDSAVPSASSSRGAGQGRGW